MATEATIGVTDLVTAQLVECAPEPAAITVVPLPPQDASPVETCREATLTETGADPPPQGRVLTFVPRTAPPLSLSVRESS